MLFEAEVKVTLKKGVLDPQGSAVAGGLAAMGYQGVREVRIGKLVQCRIEAESAAAARSQAEEMARRLLANPVLEDFLVSVRPAGEVG